MRRSPRTVPGRAVTPPLAPVPAQAPGPTPVFARASGPRGSSYRTPSEAKRDEGRARQQVVNEWHRQDLTRTEVLWTDRSRPTSEVMPLVLTRLNLEQRLAESQILQIWDRVVDPTITAHARPVGLRHGTLFINVDSNTWLSELVRYRYDEILEKLQLTVGRDKVERLSLRVG